MDQAGGSAEELLQQGIAAARAKRKAEAHALLSRAAQMNPLSEQAFLWLAAVAPTPEESLRAFERVLAINPSNEQAQVGRRWAQSRAARPSPSGAGGAASASGASAAMARPAGPPEAATAPDQSTAGGRLTSQEWPAVLSPTPVRPAHPPSPPAQLEPDTGLEQGPARPVGGSETRPVPISGASTGVYAPASAAGPSEWRGADDGQPAAAAIDWDDQGLDLGRPPAAPIPTTEAIVCPSCGFANEAGVVCARCSAPLPRSETAARPATLETTEFAPATEATPQRPGADARTASADEAGAWRAGSIEPAAAPAPRMLLPLAVGALVVLAGLAIAAYGFGLLGNRGASQPQAAAQRFFDEHFKGNTRAAAGELATTLATSYLQTNDVAGLKAAFGADRRWAVQVQPLAISPDGKEAEVIALVRPAGTPPNLAARAYNVHLVQTGGKWYIDDIKAP